MFSFAKHIINKYDSYYLILCKIYWHEKQVDILISKTRHCKYSRTSIIQISIIRTLVNQTLFWILKSFDFQQNQVKKGMPV